jgi:1-acyl-sn-glycerol-3-phosphate acyltransferase
VAIFPEGTRSLDGIIHDFKRGFILILRGTGLDVVPVTLNGMFKLKPKPRFFINPFTKLEITIHKPIEFEELREKDNAEILEQMQNIISSAYKFS